MNATLSASGRSDAGLQREENQDRFFVDRARGVFMVIDGVGGQAAGGKAADIALAMLRLRLARETGPVDERVREAITVANNEIHRVAATRPEWLGMACVMTVAVLHDGVATVGHVGDSRLYKLHHGRIDKVTRDHSPVGEREDAGDIAELDAMRHPRRHEVYRDVGSELHESGDADFIDILTIPFETDSALLLCSDGLSDLVPSAEISTLVDRHAGDPAAAVHALVSAANDAGGRDNVTVVYVEGTGFASSARARLEDGAISSNGARSAVALVAALAAAIVVGSLVQLELLEWPFPRITIGGTAATGQVVGPGQSIAAAIERAAPGTQVVVEPGEYREQIVLRDAVAVVSRVPRAAILRLPAGADSTAAVVTATGLSSATLSGFRMLGDAATPLGAGVVVRDSVVSIVDVEITGATESGLDLGGAGASVVGADVHDNPGLGLVVRAGATPRITSSAFVRNGSPEGIGDALVVESGARPLFSRNVFHGVGPDSLGIHDAAALEDLARENWFPGTHHSDSASPLQPRMPRTSQP
jgi:serine/threonine protein phosphatase PrpC